MIDTGECDVLVLDEVLNLLDWNIVSADDIIHLIRSKDDYCRLY